MHEFAIRLSCFALLGCARTGVLPSEPTDASVDGGAAPAALGGAGIGGTVDGAVETGGVAETGPAAGMGGAAAAGLKKDCSVPWAPVISVIDDAEVLHFTVPGDLPIETAIEPATQLASAPVYAVTNEVALAGRDGPTRVLARVNDPSCTPRTMFDAVYDVRPTCAPPEQTLGSSAVGMSDPLIAGWADGVQSFSLGAGSTNPTFTDPKQALGAAEGTSFGVVSLGDSGSITLSFASPIKNTGSWGFAVFENAFNDAYLELAFVEVSSDGQSFARFDSAFLGAGPKSSGYVGRAQAICGLAGSYRAGFGTPFDLQALRNQPLVQSGVVDLEAIRYVRVVDIVGDGGTSDSFGRPIYDPYPSRPNAGFDLDAIAQLRNRAANPD